MESKRFIPSTSDETEPRRQNEKNVASNWPQLCERSRKKDERVRLNWIRVSLLQQISNKKNNKWKEVFFSPRTLFVISYRKYSANALEETITLGIVPRKKEMLEKRSVGF